MEIEDIKKIKVSDGDVLVLRLTQRLSDSMRTHLSEQLKEIFDGKNIKTIVLDEGATLDVVTGDA